MVIYSVIDELQQAVEKMEELRRLIDELQPVIPNADHQRLVSLAAEVTRHIGSHNTCILREDKARQ